MSGLFAVNKPSGISSAGLLNDLQHILKKSPLFETEIQAQQARVNAGRKGRKQKMGNKIKMGHGGTLDPLASGVLVVGTGRGTKELGKFLSCSKDYEAIALFGCSTDTYDSEGKIVHRRSCRHISRDVLEAALGQFRGDIMQTPPIYSALKMQGKPLYEYAREGKPLPAEIKARPATVSRFEITHFATEHDWKLPKETAPEDIVLSAEALEKLRPQADAVHGTAIYETDHVPVKKSGLPSAPESAPPQDSPTQSPSTHAAESRNSQNATDDEPQTKRIRMASPTIESTPEKVPESVETDGEQTLAVHISMTVSSGTYVRSLIHDLGLALGSAAHMVALVRKRVGDFTLEEAVPWEDFVADNWQDALKKKLDFGEEVFKNDSPVLSDTLPNTPNTADSAIQPLERQVLDFLRPCHPFTKTLTYAQSLDGRISGPASSPLTISSPESFRITHELRRQHDLILVGVGTAVSDNPGLNARDSAGKAYPLEEQPVPVILDPHGRLSLSPTSKLMSNVRKGIGKQPIQLIHESMKDQHQTCATVVYVQGSSAASGSRQRFTWPDIFKALAPYGTSIMIEGGARVIADVLSAGAANIIIVTVAPTYIGDGTALELRNMVPLQGVRTETFGRDAVFVGRPRVQ